ncbi:hypothetical protein DRJ48_01560 [Candidatus Woesearchaeota archaeon]|nr:MAG: hypothetical protein DRJ48_01560 [Candidatus Woesearchaeota archaeon]
MVDPNSHKTLEDFVDGITRLDDAIRELNPDYILYTIRGAVPIADLLRIVDPQIATWEHEYLPASSSIIDTTDVIYQWFLNFLRETHVVGHPQSIVTIDEIVSGNSVSRVYKQVARAISDYAREVGLTPQQAMEEIVYHSIGLLDKSKAPNEEMMAKRYRQLVDDGVVIPVEVTANIVMDKPKLCPLKMQRIPNSRSGKFLPVMAKFEHTPEYMELLQRFANYVGQDIANVSLQSPLKVQQSERFLPEKYRSLRNYLSHN